LFRGVKRRCLIPASEGVSCVPESAERSMLASIAANERWSRVPDRRDATKAARQGFSDRFERMVDPAGELEPEERARRAAAAQKAHMTRLALASAKSRRAKASARDRAARYRKTAESLRRAAADLDELADPGHLADNAL
jgi:hypothetical protein